MPDVKKLAAKLTLDNKNFKTNLSDSEKQVLKFSGSVTAAGAAILAATKFAANYQDEMIKSARAAGVGAETFSAYAYAAGLSNVSTDLLRTSLSKLNNITPAVAKNLENFGVNVKDSNGNLKDSQTLMGDLADKMAQLKSPADQSALAVAAFGEKGGKMVNLLSGGRAALEGMTAEAENFGLVVSQKAGQNAEIFNDNIAKVGLSMKGLTSTIAESIIEFTNQSGIVSAISQGIAKLTGFWRGLDSDVKDFIVTLGAVTVGTATLVSGIIALKAAFTALSGFLSPTILIIGAVSAAITGLIAVGVKYSDQIQNVIGPAISYLKEAFAPIINGVKILYDSFIELIGGINNTGSQISILGTTVKTFAAVISTIAVTITAAFQSVSNYIYNMISGIINAGKVLVNFFTGDFKAAQENAKKTLDSFNQATFGTVAIAKKAADSIKNIWSQNFKIKIDSKEIDSVNNKLPTLQKNINNLDSSTQAYTPIVNALEEAFKKAAQAANEFKNGNQDLGQVISTTASAIGKSVDILGQFANQAVKISDFIAKDIMRSAQRANLLIDKQLIDLKKNYDNQIDTYKTAEDEKIKALEKSYDDQINIIKNQEEIKNNQIALAAQERLLLLDNEYQQEKAKQEEAFQAYIASETEKYEVQKALILAKTADKEQAQLVESQMNADFNAYLEQLQIDHDQQMLDLANDYVNQQTEINTQTEADIVSNTESANQQISDIEQQKADSVTAANDQMAQDLTDMQNAYNDEQKALENEKLQNQYDAERAAYETTKAAKIAEVVVAGIAAAINIIAAMAPLGPPGLIVGGILAAGIAVSTGLAVADIQSSAPPPPPQLLADGGFIGGSVSHAQGGFNAEIESKEFIIDKQKTNKINDFIDSGLQKNSGDINIYFTEGAISGINLDSEEAGLKIGQIIGDQLKRQGVVV